MHLCLFIAFVILVPGIPFAMAVVSSPDLTHSPFFGRPDLPTAVHLGHKRILWSGILSSFTDLIVILVSAYTSNGNCTHHCFLFHHIGMTLSGAICGRITELSAIAAIHVLTWHRICPVGSASACPKIRSINGRLWQIYDLLSCSRHIVSQYPHLPMFIIVAQVKNEMACGMVSERSLVFLQSPRSEDGSVTLG